jgi:hypothetical protein
MRAGQWLLTIVLTLLIPSVRDLGATSACGHAKAHQMLTPSATTSLEVVADAGTTRDCGTGQPHTSGNNCTTMPACVVGVAIPEAPPVSYAPGVESSQVFPVVASPHDRTTLPHTPPPR